MKKFTIKKDKEPITDQEINKQMNFDKFINGYTPPVKGWFSGGVKLYGIVAAGVAVVAIAGYLLIGKNNKEQIAEKPFVAPPVKTLDIVPESFIVDSNTDTTLIYSTGSIITIPSNSFADAEGKDVSGKIKIHYREFHDQIDIMLSGIPMNYDSAGTRYLLESAGMFEITATLNDKPVFLKPGRSLVVNMISHTNNETDYNIYNLDTAQKKWNYVSENTAANQTCISAFENRQTADNSADEFASAAIKSLVPQKATRGRDNFTIDFNKDEFPELAVFNGLKFEPVAGEKKYNAGLSKKTWANVVINKDGDNEHYIVTFSNSKESHSFKVSPVVDEKDYDAAMKDFAARQKKYEAILSEKMASQKKMNDSLYKINSAFKYVASKNMNDRFKSFIKNSYNESSKDLLAYRAFRVSKLGVWNSDRPWEPPIFANYEPVSGDHKAEFISTAGEHLLFRNIFLIKRSVNTILSFASEHFDKFPYHAKQVDVMVGITYENKIFYLKDQDLKQSEMNGKNTRFRMKETGSNIVNPGQLKDLLKI